MNEEYELLIIGGGIIGASCAYEASLRGAKVLLVEQSDFGSKTSEGSFKIVHGGLRYLQHLDFPRLRESVNCQNYIRRFASHLVKTLPFIVPCYGYGMQGKEVLRVACEIYNILSIDRNRGVSKDQILPRYRTLSAEELLKIAPHVDRARLRGGVVFFDSQMLDPDRLILEFILSAQRQGAYFRNYTEAKRITVTDDGYSVEIKDKISGFSKEVRAKFIVNAMGPWASKLTGMLGGDSQPRSKNTCYSKGIQIGIRDFPIFSAISVQTKGIDTAASINRGGRAIFLQPWRDYTLVGTTDTIYRGSPDDFSISQEEIDGLFEEVLHAYPDPVLSKAKIAFSFGGLRPIDPTLKDYIERGDNRDGLVNTSRDEDLIDHKEAYAEWGMAACPNMLSIVGIKYTTCRSVAIRVLDLLSKKGFSSENRGADYFNVGSAVQPIEELASIERDLSSQCPDFNFVNLAREIWETYGVRANEFLSRLNLSNVKEKMQVQNIVEREMILNTLQNEYAKNMQDIAVRRLSRKLYAPHNGAFLRNLADIYRTEVGWDKDKISSELEQIEKIFPIEKS